jgi:hypothetical protein
MLAINRLRAPPARKSLRRNNLSYKKNLDWLIKTAYIH